MKVERIDSNTSGRPAREPNLPGDFAWRVIVKARAERRKRQTRHHIAAAGVCAVLMVAAIPIAGFMRSTHSNLASREASALAQRGQQDQSLEEANVDQVAQATKPDEIDDYLIPNTAALTEFASAYTDASWHYDPSWSDDR
jgi:hypothetical protein